MGWTNPRAGNCRLRCACSRGAVCWLSGPVFVRRVFPQVPEEWKHPVTPRRCWADVFICNNAPGHTLPDGWVPRENDLFPPIFLHHAFLHDCRGSCFHVFPSHLCVFPRLGSWQLPYLPRRKAVGSGSSQPPPEFSAGSPGRSTASVTGSNFQGVLPPR